MIFWECEFKHVHTSRFGVHEAVAFISGTFALKLKARRGLVVPKTTRDHPGKRFALGRRHWGEDTHFQVDIHRLRAVIFKVGWKHQCFRILYIYIYIIYDCICVSPFLTGSFLHPPNDEQLPGCTGGSSRTHSPCSGRSPGKQRKPTSSAEVLMDFCLQTVGLPNACHGTR